MSAVSGKRVGHLAGTAFLWTAIVVAVLPLTLMAINSLKLHGEILANPLSLPTWFNVTNFVQAWTAGNFTRGLVNSLLISGSTVLITLVCASLAAYPLARQKIRFARLFTLYFLGAVTVPIQLFLFPLFFVYAQLGFVGNPIATSVILAAVNLPLSILLLRTYVLNVPRELDDAAFMDGARKWQVFAFVIIPLMRPGLITVAIIVGLNAWNDYLITSTFQQGSGSQTMMLGFLSMNNVILTDRGILMAGAAIVVVPIIVFFLIMQRLFIEGVTSGAVKG
ncbi:MAG: carbohydrate ABC transporter permease [Devosia sp.]|jgi:raffinose/stachyose/melibiose transport system permease protein|uniref:carbohydrate ABC transporter permease n=1 Tax=Devosia sp. TaxID=1871048 RepID=UPI001A453EC0|nr:carbohydrate ABC transporter permease [Devosia sp.]MBL8600211.1 carbohydrate ABC transporter permease [Devosia sp.]